MIEQHLQEFCHYFNCDQDELEKHKVKFISLGKQDSYFSGNFTQGDGRSVVQELLAKKVSAIMPVAGPQTFDCTQEIINQHSHAVVIGVDTAQENDPTVQRESHYVDKNNNQQVIKFSAQKNITNMLTDILNNVKVNGHLGKIGIGGYGDLTVGDFRNEGAHSSRNSIRYLKDFFQVFLTSYP
jgi:basic membrane lipoprotein Med (substrate-binding protein (PBP1-ABC) superfamily)